MEQDKTALQKDVSDIKRLLAEIKELEPPSARLKALRAKLGKWQEEGILERVPWAVAGYLEAFKLAVEDPKRGHYFFTSEERKRAEVIYAVDRLPKALSLVTLDDLKPRADIDTFDEACRFVRYWCETAAQKITDGQGITFCGDTGTGKSSLAAIAAKGAAMTKVPVLYTTALDLFAAFKPNATGDLAEQITRWRVLMIDDLGNEYASEYTLATLDQVVTTRYDSCKPTIITTNYYPEELASEADIAPRVIDRLAERNAVWTFKGASWRQRKEGDET